MNNLPEYSERHYCERSANTNIECNTINAKNTKNSSRYTKANVFKIAFHHMPIDEIKKDGISVFSTEV